MYNYFSWRVFACGHYDLLLYSNEYKMHRTEYSLALVSRKGIGTGHCRVYTRKKISVPRNLLLISEEIGPKKQWQTKNCRFLKVLGGRAKRDKLNSFLPLGLGKGDWGGYSIRHISTRLRLRKTPPTSAYLRRIHPFSLYIH